MARGGVNVYLDPENFDGVVDRHGQRVLWKAASPCVCVSEDGVANPNCNLCQGRGQRYTIPEDVESYFKVKAKGRVVEIPSDVDALAILKVAQNRSGTELAVWSTNLTDGTITLAESPIRGDVLKVTYTKNREEMYLGVGTKVDTRLYEANLVGDISSDPGNVIVVDDTGASPEEYTGQAVWANRVYVNDTPASPTIQYTAGAVTVSCKYAEPFKVALQQVTPKLIHQVGSFLQGYDALVTIPSGFFAGSGDLFSTITMEVRNSFVGRGDGSQVDLPVFNVKRVLRAYDDQGDLPVSLIGSSRIEWMSRTPTGKYVVVFTYHPTFKVFLDIPTPRYAEEKVFPTRVLAKRYDSVSEIRLPQAPVQSGQGLIGGRFGEEVTF